MNPAPGTAYIYVVDPAFPEGPHQRITPDYAASALRRGEITPTDRPGIARLNPDAGLRKLSGAEARRRYLNKRH